MEHGDPNTKMMTFDDLARLAFKTNPGLIDIVWNTNTKRRTSLS
jgi:hypothetical protein